MVHDVRLPMRLSTLLLCACLVAPTSAQGFHQRRPNGYRQAVDDNVATALDRRLAAGDVRLEPHGRSGRLRALLRELRVPEASQTLVFSKTSLQRHRISPASPRAIYFGPDAYVGWVDGAAALELAVADARLGVVFYTLVQDPAAPPRIVRDDSCLRCHASSHTDDEPGIVLRSVFPDGNGDPIASAGETIVTTSTPLAERWGGWILTGAFVGDHRGNGIADRDERGVWHVRPRRFADLAACAPQFDAGDYLAPTSDIAALLALEQQATVHNLLVRAAFQTRCLLENDRTVNAALGETGVRESTADILDTLAATIVAHLLLQDEPSLRDHAAAPDPAFATAFAAQWPVDPDGVRLGVLDLRERLFVLPLSPMVHSSAFAALPDELRARVLHRLRRALADGRLPRNVRVSPEERATLHAHLTATLPGYTPPK